MAPSAGHKEAIGVVSIRGIRASIFIAIATVASSAHAQSSAPPASAAPAASATDQDAHAAFDRARALFQRGNFDAALAEFQRVYELMDGNPRRYIVLFNIAQSNERLFRYDEALRYYQRYLDEGGAAVTDRPQIEAVMSALGNLLGTLDVRVNVPSAEIWVDERHIGTAPGTVMVPGGQHVVQVRATGYAPSQQEVQLPAHATRQINFTLEALNQHHGPSPVFFFGATAAAVVAYGFGVGFGIQALVLHADAESRRQDPVLQWGLMQSDLQAIRNAALTADIFYATGGVLTIAAVVLYLMTDFGHHDAPAHHAYRGPVFSPTVTNGGLGFAGAVTF